jgi:hypothetical protein
MAHQHHAAFISEYLSGRLVNPDGTESRPNGTSRLSRNVIWINSILPLGFQGFGFLEINESGIDMAKGSCPN